MDNDKKKISFGHYLKVCRLDKEYSVDYISKKTKISLANILSIENEDHDSLPESIYVRGFLQSYGRVLGIDIVNLTKDYNSHLDNYLATQKSSDVNLFKSNITLIMNLFLIVFSFSCIIFISLYLFSSVGSESEKNQTSLESQEINKEIINKKKQIDEKKVISSKFVLDVVAMEDTIVKVIIDGKSPESFNMKMGENISIKAKKEINFLASSATGVMVKLNNKKIDIEGKTGQYINLYFTAK